MSHVVSGTIPDVCLSRRAAIGRLAVAGAAATIAATPFGKFPATAQAAAPHTRSSVAMSRKGTIMTQSTPATDDAALTVVLVHGAFADSSGWNGIIPDLLAQGYAVVAAANPLRSIPHDAAYVASVLDGITGPIVLVGHSYGGFVISNAAVGNDNVKALVYVAAFAPDAGESANDLAGRFPGSTLGPALAGFPSPDGVDLYIRNDVFWSQFCEDVPEVQATLMAGTQRPVTEAALTEGSGEPAWKTIPSWFVYGELDKNIPAAAEVFMAERAGANVAIEIPGASHVPMISQPQAVTDVILTVIDAVSLVGAAS